MDALAFLQAVEADALSNTESAASANRVRTRLASDGFQGQMARRTCQSSEQYQDGLLAAMAVSGLVLNGGAGCLRSMRVQGRPAGWRAAALYLFCARFACRPPGCYS